MDNHLGQIIFAVLVLFIAFIVTRILRGVLTRYIKRQTEHLNNDPTKYRFLKNSVSGVVWLTAIGIVMYVIPGGRTLAVSLFAGAGIFAAVIGFASQAAFSNIISGIFIVLFKPFRVNDVLQIGTNASFVGVVEDITLRHVVIRNYENRRIIIPNSVISAETLTNSTIGDQRICRHIEVVVSYDSDHDLAKNLIQREAENHRLTIDARTPEALAEGAPKVRVKVIALEDSGVRIRAWVWAETVADAFEIMTDLFEKCLKMLPENGIEIPYPHRTLVLKNVPTGKGKGRTSPGFMQAVTEQPDSED